MWPATRRRECGARRGPRDRRAVRSHRHLDQQRRSLGVREARGHAGHDAKRLFDTNFWGVVNGSRAALPHLASHGGALINVGSEASGAILFAAEHPRRDLYVGGKAKLSTMLSQRWPTVSDRLLARFGSRMQKTNRPLSGADDGGLYQSRSALMVRGQPQGRVLSRSLYTKATEHRAPVALRSSA